MSIPRPNLVYRRDAIVTELERRRAIPADERAKADAAHRARVESAARTAAETAGLLPTDDELERELAEVNAQIAEHDRGGDDNRAMPADVHTSIAPSADPAGGRGGRRFPDLNE